VHVYTKQLHTSGTAVVVFERQAAGLSFEHHISLQSGGPATGWIIQGLPPFSFL
jgi:hypothetical protein